MYVSMYVCITHIWQEILFARNSQHIVLFGFINVIYLTDCS